MLVSKNVTLPLFTFILQFPLAIHLVAGVVISEFIVPFDMRPICGPCSFVGMLVRFVCVSFPPIIIDKIFDSSTFTLLPPPTLVSFSDIVECIIGLKVVLVG